MEWYYWAALALLVLLVFYYVYMSSMKQGHTGDQPTKEILVHSGTIDGLKLPYGYHWVIPGPHFYSYDSKTKLYSAYARN